MVCRLKLKSPAMNVKTLLDFSSTFAMRSLDRGYVNCLVLVDFVVKKEVSVWFKDTNINVSFSMVNLTWRKVTSSLLFSALENTVC